MKNIAIKAFLFLVSVSLICSMFGSALAADETTDVEGILIDEQGNALANETVSLSNGMTTITASDGSFLFENVTVGSYELIVEMGDGEEFIHEFTASAGENDLGEIIVGEEKQNFALLVAFLLPSLVVFGIVFNILRKRKKNETA